MSVVSGFVTFFYQADWQRQYRRADARFTRAWSTLRTLPKVCSPSVSKRRRRASLEVMRAAAELTPAYARQFPTQALFDVWYAGWRCHGTPPATALLSPFRQTRLQLMLLAIRRAAWKAESRLSLQIARRKRRHRSGGAMQRKRSPDTDTRACPGGSADAKSGSKGRMQAWRARARAMGLRPVHLRVPEGEQEAVRLVARRMSTDTYATHEGAILESNSTLPGKPGLVAEGRAR